LIRNKSSGLMGVLSQEHAPAAVGDRDEVEPGVDVVDRLAGRGAGTNQLTSSPASHTNLKLTKLFRVRSLFPSKKEAIKG
jgi:hypothetical protein